MDAGTRKCVSARSTRRFVQPANVHKLWWLARSACPANNALYDSTQEMLAAGTVKTHDRSDIYGPSLNICGILHNCNLYSAAVEHGDSFRVLFKDGTAAMHLVVGICGSLELWESAPTRLQRSDIILITLEILLDTFPPFKSNVV